MPVFDFTTKLPAEFFGSVTAIGNFDAVHRGHQALLEIARKRALHVGAPFSVLTFEPHPRSLFAPDLPPFRVTPMSVKHDLLTKFGADIILSLPFTFETSQQSASNFISEILSRTLNISEIVCGYDFHFGHNREGQINDIQNAGISVTQVGAISDSTGQIYSATRVRESIKNGDMKKASHLLGWNWFIRGKVIHGDKRGRTIGYPTLNMRLDETIHPLYGVYASFTRHQGKLYKSITNVGIRPMFEVSTPLVETYIFDFNGDLYNETVDILPVYHIRPEMKFSSLDELKSKIDSDCNIAQSILNQCDWILS